MRYQSLIVGICLLVGAFLFGRMINQPHLGRSSQLGSTDALDSGAADETERPSLAHLPSTSQPRQSLKDLLQGKQKRRSHPAESPFHLPSGDRSLVRDRKKELTTESPSLDATEQPPAVATPDFSSLAGPLTAPTRLADDVVGRSYPPDEVVDAVPPGRPRADQTKPGSGIEVGPIGRTDETRLTTRRSGNPPSMPRRQWVRPGPETLGPDTFGRQTPLQMGVSAKSELARVHQRSRRIALDTDQFVNHRVEPGETLQSISETYYGRPDYYLDIYLANQDVMANPSNLSVGQTLKIPVFP